MTMTFIAFSLEILCSLSLVSQQWDQAPSRLKAFAENQPVGRLASRRYARSNAPLQRFSRRLRICDQFYNLIRNSFILLQALDLTTLHVLNGIVDFAKRIKRVIY